MCVCVSGWAYAKWFETSFTLIWRLKERLFLESCVRFLKPTSVLFYLLWTYIVVIVTTSKRSLNLHTFPLFGHRTSGAQFLQASLSVLSAQVQHVMYSYLNEESCMPVYNPSLLENDAWFDKMATVVYFSRCVWVDVFI